MKAEIKGKALIDFEKILKEVEVSCFNEGEKVGRENGVNEYIQEMESEFEKSNSEYVVFKFADCKTFDEFQTLYNEIRNLSYTYMK